MNGRLHTSEDHGSECQTLPNRRAIQVWLIQVIMGLFIDINTFSRRHSFNVDIVLERPRLACKQIQVNGGLCFFWFKSTITFPFLNQFQWVIFIEGGGVKKKVIDVYKIFMISYKYHLSHCNWLINTYTGIYIIYNSYYCSIIELLSPL